jgi:hypothetical protein
MHIFADQINQVSLSNGNLRITLSQRGPDNITEEVGTLIIPASQANNFMNGLANSLKELGEKVKTAREGQTEQ